jgi:hypothetical protein
MAPVDRIDRHIEAIRLLSSPGGPLGAGAATATIRNRDWFFQSPSGLLRPFPQRYSLHRALRDYLIGRSPVTGLDRMVIVTVGPPGAGKGTVLRNEFALNGFLVVDADEFKALLLREAIRDGSYESWVEPAAVKDLEARGERFAPLELAALVHEESSMLAASMRAGAITEGRNLVVDSVMADAQNALALGRRLAAAGYRITVVDVEVPFDVSAASIRERYRDGYERATAGDDALGGRWVPSEYARGVFNGPGEPSKPELAARALAEQCPAVMEYRLYRGAEAGGPRQLETRMVRATPGGPLSLA